ncbi:MAG: efflux RND transporter permease subunit, partial [Pseudomonadota bacterium]
MNTTPPIKHNIIAWFAENHVAANLLMILILVMGAFSLFNIKKATMPDFETNMLEIQVPYPGAAPAEVERGIVIKLEEAIKD